MHSRVYNYLSFTQSAVLIAMIINRILRCLDQPFHFIEHHKVANFLYHKMTKPSNFGVENKFAEHMIISL